MKRIFIAVFLVFMLAACSDQGPKLTLKADNEKFEQEQYTVKKGEKTRLIVDSKELQAIEIKGADVNVTKDKPKQDITIEQAGLYEITGSLGDGKFIKSVLVVE